MLPVYYPYSMENIPSGFDLLQLFVVDKVNSAVQIFVLEFSEDGSADLRDEFTDGGSANQPVILQGGLGLHYCQFLPVFDAVVYAFDEVKKAGGILTKFW